MDDMAQAMSVLLPGDVRRKSAGILHVFVTVDDVIDGLRFGAIGIPHMCRKYHRVAAWVVIENHFAGGVGKNAAIPVQIAIDANRWESRGQGARCHDMSNRQAGVATVEIAHLAAAQMRGSHGKPGFAAFKT